MTDLAVIGVSFDPSELVSGVKASEEAMDRLAASFKNGTTSSDDFGRSLDKLGVTQQIEVLQRLGLTAEQAAGQIKAAYGGIATSAAATAEAHTGLNTKVAETSGVLGGLLGFLPGYGAAHEETATHVVTSGHAHHALSDEVRELSHILHALHPSVAEAGLSISELSAFSYIARRGIGLLGVALGATFVVELVKTQAEMEKLKGGFEDVFGSAGPDMMMKSNDAAKTLGTTLDKLAPSVMAAYDQLRKGAIAQEQDQKKALGADGVQFVSGDAGQAALKSMLNSSRELVVDASSATGKELQKLEKLYEQTGVSASSAWQKVSQLWGQLPQTAEQASAVALKATADITKLFEVSGKGGDDAAAATEKFFAEIKKGGLTSDVFDKLATESRVTAQTIAEGFGFKGPEAIARFSHALEEVKGISFDETVAGLLSVQDKVDKLEIKPSLSKSWGELKTAFRQVFEEIVDGLNETKAAAGSNPEDGGAAAQVLNGIAGALKKITPSVVKEVNGELRDLLGIMKEVKEWYAWAGTLSDKINTALAPLKAEMEKIPVLGAAATVLSDSLVNAAVGTVNGHTGTLSRPWVPETGMATIGAPTDGSGATESATATDQTEKEATASVGQLNDSLDKTQTDAKAAATATEEFTTSLTSFGDDTGKAAENSKSLAAAMEQADTQLASSAQSIPNSISSAESSLQSFFSWLVNAAAQVAQAQSDASAAASSGGGGGGGDGPQLDFSDTADLGPNAVGGVYTIGTTGGVAGGSTRASGTDTINLKGSVSPGEVVAVIPADKANQATMSALQTIINTAEPISIGGGSVSGTGGGANVSSELAGLLDGTGTAYPASLSDPAVKDLLAQIKALLASQYVAKSLNGTPAAAAAAGAAAAATGATASQQGDPFAEIKKQEAEAEAYRKQQEKEDAAANKGAASQSRASSGGGGGGRPSKSDGPGVGPGADGVIRLPQSATEAATPFEFTPLGDGSPPFTEPYDNYDPGAYSEPYDNYNPGYGETYDNYNPGAYGETYDNYTAGSDSSSYSPFNDSSYTDTAFDPGSYADSSSYADIGENATGGVYTIGSGAGSGNSGVTDALNLVGKVSPGEIVAVIPPEAATSATMSTLHGMVGKNVTSLGGGGAHTLSLSSAQVQDALAKVQALIAAELAAKNLSAKSTASTPAAAAAGGGGGGFNTKKGDDEKKKPQDQQPEKGGAAPASRASGRPSETQRINLPKTPQPGDNAAQDAVNELGASGGMLSTQMPFDSNFMANGQTSFFDPFSAYASDNFGYAGNSYDQPYDSQFYSPYSAGTYGDNFSFDGSQYLEGYAGGSDYTDTLNYDYGSTYDSVGMGSDGSSGSSVSGDYYGGDTSSSDITGGDASFYDAGSYDYGDAGDFATGGTFTVPDAEGGGTDTVDTRMHLTGGETVSIMPKGSKATASVADAPAFSVDRSAPQPDSMGPTMRSMVAADDRSTRVLGGNGRSSTAPIALDRTAQGRDIQRVGQMSGPNDRTVNVNVFGVRDAESFAQSRQAIARATRLVGQ